MSPTYWRSVSGHLVIGERSLWDITAGINHLVTTPCPVETILIVVVFSRYNVVPLVGFEGLLLCIQSEVSLIQFVIGSLKRCLSGTVGVRHCLLSLVDSCLEGSFLACGYISEFLLLYIVFGVGGVTEYFGFHDAGEESHSVGNDSCEISNSLLEFCQLLVRYFIVLPCLTGCGEKSFHLIGSCLDSSIIGNRRVGLVYRSLEYLEVRGRDVRMSVELVGASGLENGELVEAERSSTLDDRRGVYTLILHNGDVLDLGYLSPCGISTIDI